MIRIQNASFDRSIIIIIGSLSRSPCAPLLLPIDSLPAIISF